MTIWHAIKQSKEDYEYSKSVILNHIYGDRYGGDYKEEFDKAVDIVVERTQSVMEKYNLTFEQASSIVMFAMKDVEDTCNLGGKERFWEFIIEAVDYYFKLRKD